MASGSKYMSLAEVADTLNTHRDTVRNYVARGALTAYRLPTSRNLLFKRADVERFAESVPVVPTVIRK